MLHYTPFFAFCQASVLKFHSEVQLLYESPTGLRPGFYAHRALLATLERGAPPSHELTLGDLLAQLKKDSSKSLNIKVRPRYFNNHSLVPSPLVDPAL